MPRWLTKGGLALGLAAALLIMAGLAAHLEAVSRLAPEALKVRAGTLVLDREGRVLRLTTGARGGKVVTLPGGRIPPQVAAAFIAAEDGRFWRHPGVDVLAILRAAASNLAHGRIVSGASTITQQLVRLSYPGPRSYHGKLVEICRSLRAEMALSKEEILRRYLNRVPLGHNLVGVEAGAAAYFGKTAAQLTPGEAAVLAALVKAPGRLNPYGPRRERLLARQRWVLQRLAQLGYLSPGQYQAARTAMVQFRGDGPRPPAFPFEAPHFVNLVLTREQPLPSGAPRLKTTLDLALQRRAQAIVASHRVRLLKAGATQAAAVIVANRSREVLALVGSMAYERRGRGFNNGAAAWRSPGSTLKPFLYALALDQGFTPAAVLEDIEARYRTPRGEFIPSNFDRVCHGPVSFREALGNSLNLSAVHLLNLIGPATYYDTLAALGLINHPEFSPDHYGLGLVVGNPEVSLLQLATAYACLANGGLFAPLRLVASEPAPGGTRIFSPQAAYIINDILSDSLARARIFGGAAAMNPPYPMAIKTGTSTKARDLWTVAYTPEYTLAVWVGNFDGRPTNNLCGATAAAPIVADLAEILLAGNPPGPFPRPPGVVSAEVCAFSGMRPGPGCRHRRRELFLAGAEPRNRCTYHQPREPWHRMPAKYADWLYQRFETGGEGRFRLANFDQDLGKTFRAPVPAGSGLLKRGGGADAGAHGLTPRVSLSSPLDGDRFLLKPGVEEIRLTARARCRESLYMVTWYVDGREVAATGPPYELALKLYRGRHRLTVVGPGGVGDSVTVMVQ